MKQPRTPKGYITVMAALFTVGGVAYAVPRAAAEMLAADKTSPRTVHLRLLASFALMAVGCRFIPQLEGNPTALEELEYLAKRFGGFQSERTTETESPNRNQRRQGEVSEGNAGAQSEPD